MSMTGNVNDSELSANRMRPTIGARAAGGIGDIIVVKHVIIGTGFSGLAVALALDKSGEDDFIILERAGEIGGVWRDNRYWGCACDVPSHLYSLASFPSAEWTRRFPRQDEVLNYLRQGFASRGLDGKCLFGREVRCLSWDDDAKLWTIELADQTRIQSTYVHAGTGQLPKRTLPDVRGLGEFEGVCFHSAEWPDALDLKGKRVAVVGTGASAVQIIPEVARAAGTLIVFQRNAPYVLPRNDRAFTRLERALLRRWAWRQAYRAWLYVRHEANALAFFSFARLLGVVRRQTLRAVRQHLPEQQMHAAVAPAYGAGCKRVLVSDDYYPALARSNVELIPSPLAMVEGHTATAADGRQRDVDVLIFATGFDGTLPMPGIKVVGRAGRVLHDLWNEDGVNAFYGTQVAGFPNLFLLIGPNIGLAHNSVIYMMESQVEYIMRAIKWADRSSFPAEIRADKQSRFNDVLSRLMARTPWQRGGCTSWYHDRQGRNVGLWPDYTFLFRMRLRRVRLDSHMRTRPNDMAASSASGVA